MNYFIITIDTEGDNQWGWQPGNTIETKNTAYLERFQLLCDKYEFKPVWLSNYEMLQDNKFVEFIKVVEQENKGELGMHLHAWSTPPEYELNGNIGGAPYLIEYPIEVMEKKIKNMTDIIVEKTGIRPTTHRAGRWATNQNYFDLLIKYGYNVDCSVTPGIDWSKNIGQSYNSKGSDYSGAKKNPYTIFHSEGKGSLLEIPVTLKRVHTFSGSVSKSTIKRSIRNVYNLFFGRMIWVRPNGNNIKDMIRLVEMHDCLDNNYIMFMLHSSELMPGGSPTFVNDEEIERLYVDLESLFDVLSKKNYRGITLREYRKVYANEEHD